MLLMSTSLSQLTVISLSIGTPLRFISRAATTCMFDRFQLITQSGLARRIWVQIAAWSLPGIGFGNSCSSKPSFAASVFISGIGSCPNG